MECSRVLLDEFKHIPLFEALDDVQLKRIMQTTRRVSVPAKTRLFERGSEANYFYVLNTGQIKLFCLSSDGGEKVMEVIYPKQSFAEAIMFMSQHVYPVSSSAIVDSEVYQFSMKSFRSILQESQECCFRLLGIMGRRLHAKVNDISNLTLHNATYRIVVYLLEQLPDDAEVLSDIYLSTPKNIVASRLSIKPETFSRIMLQLSKSGLIEVDGNDITIMSVDGLRALL